MVGIYDYVANEVNENSEISASLRNSKVGNILGFNTLSGNSPYIKKDGTVLTTYKGTCGGCCELCENDCYARNYTIRRHNTCIPSYIKNTEIMRRDLQNYVDQIVERCKKEIGKYKYCRYHESGEFESFEQMIGTVDAGIRVPDMRFYFYSKRFADMEKIEESGGFPNNVSALVSIWYDENGNKNYDNPYGFAEFIYDNGSNPELDKLFHCPAVFIDGTSNKKITCEKCGRCPNAKKGMKTAVYAHGKTKWHRQGVDVKDIAKKQKEKWNKVN